jgi:hypothetical protein
MKRVKESTHLLDGREEAVSGAEDEEDDKEEGCTGADAAGTDVSTRTGRLRELKSIRKVDGHSHNCITKTGEHPHRQEIQHGKMMRENTQSTVLG